MLRSYPPDLPAGATTLALIFPGSPSLLAFNIRLPFIRELSALCTPGLTAFIPALSSMAFSLHLFKLSFLPPPPTSVCLPLTHIARRHEAFPPPSPTGYPLSEPWAHSRSGAGSWGGGGG